MPDLKSVVEEVRGILKQVFGIVLDARQGFHHVAATTEKVQTDLLGRVPGATQDTLDASPYLYSEGPPTHDPDDNAAPWLHRTTHRELKSRNRPGGLNDDFVGNMCLVYLYTYWEDHYRAKVAEALSVEKSAIKSPVFGDIRLIRNSIVHHRAVALEEIERCELLKWFRIGEPIAISTPQFRQLASEVNVYLDRLASQTAAGAA